MGTNTYKAWSEITTRTQWDQTGQKHSAGYGGGRASLVHVNNTPARRLFEGLHVSYTHNHLLLSIVFDFLSILNLTKWIILYQKPHKFRISHSPRLYRSYISITNYYVSSSHYSL